MVTRTARFDFSILVQTKYLVDGTYLIIVQSTEYQNTQQQQYTTTHTNPNSNVMINIAANKGNKHTKQ